MKAYDFSYDNRNLSEFGCILCSFGDKDVETVSDGCEITFNTIPTLNGSKHNLQAFNMKIVLRLHCRYVSILVMVAFKK